MRMFVCAYFGLGVCKRNLRNSSFTEETTFCSSSPWQLQRGKLMLPLLRKTRNFSKGSSFNKQGGKSERTMARVSCRSKSEGTWNGHHPLKRFRISGVSNEVLLIKKKAVTTFCYFYGRLLQSRSIWLICCYFLSLSDNADQTTTLCWLRWRRCHNSTKTRWHIPSIWSKSISLILGIFQRKRTCQSIFFPNLIFCVRRAGVNGSSGCGNRGGNADDELAIYDFSSS